MKSFLLGSAATVLLVGLAFAQIAPTTPPGHSATPEIMPGTARVDGGKAAASGDSNQAIATTKANADQPAKGANSFTESEARRRLEEHGFSNITGLTKDQDGVWRGMAQKGGKSASVWLDYKGNVGQQS